MGRSGRDLSLLEKREAMHTDGVVCARTVSGMEVVANLPALLGKRQPSHIITEGWPWPSRQVRGDTYDG